MLSFFILFGILKFIVDRFSLKSEFVSILFCYFCYLLAFALPDLITVYTFQLYQLQDFSWFSINYYTVWKLSRE